jgi:hypothetical protein
VNTLTHGSHDHLGSGPAQDIDGRDELQLLHTISQQTQDTLRHRINLRPDGIDSKGFLMRTEKQRRYNIIPRALFGRNVVAFFSNERFTFPKRIIRSRELGPKV